MRRTQLYLDDQLWNALHTRARTTGTTLSELVRIAVRDRYLGNLEARREAMQALVGLQKGRREFENPEAYIRRLRGGSSLETLEAE